VRHEHHRAGVLGENVSKPRDRLDVQVIGRLVEQQQIRLTDERTEPTTRAAPAAGEVSTDGVGGRFRRAQARGPRDVTQPLIVCLEGWVCPSGNDVGTPNRLAREERSCSSRAIFSAG